MASVTLRTKEIEKKGYSLFLDIYNEGKRYKEYLKLYVSKDYTKAENKNVLKVDKDSWDLAKAIQAKRLTVINESNAGFIPKASKRDFISYYREQAAKKNHDSYENALQYLLDFIKRDKLSFKAIDDKFLKDYIAFFATKPLSASSVRMYLSRFSIVLNLAVKDKIIQVNPFTYLKRGVGGDIPLGVKNKIEYLTIEELRLLNNTTYRDDIKQFFFFSCFSGLRISDLLKMKWAEIENNTLTYTQKKQRNAKTHYLPLSAQAVSLLADIESFQIKKMTAKHELVFAHLPDKRMLNRHLKSWAEDAELKKNLHIHVGRHSFATLALTNGVSLYTVSKMLGHSNISVTQIYAEVVDEMKQKAAELMPSL
jgi:site-specific recombinase XerD